MIISIHRIVRLGLLLGLSSFLVVSEAFFIPRSQELQQSQQNHHAVLSSSSLIPSPVSFSNSKHAQPLHASSGLSSTGDKATYIDPDFRLAGIFLISGILLDFVPILQFTLGPILTLLGVLFLVQTFRLTFVCDSKAFELLNTAQESGENIIVGGANRWAYTSFVNYEFFPKGWIDQPQGPILVYFKENQTPSVEWNQGPGQSANSPEALARGAQPGQVHFFPALCNCQQLRAEWEKRGCKKLN